MIFETRLPKTQQQLLKEFQTKKLPLPFYLAGGTSLALQLGHRESVDFDFFTKEKFQPESLKKKLILNHKYKVNEIVQLEENTLTIILSGIKVSFFGGYGFQKIGKTVKTPYFPLASLEDIMCMKLLALQHRSELKDYIDIYSILHQPHGDLARSLKRAQKKFGKLFNPMISLKALVYFNDLDEKEFLLIPLTDKKLTFRQIKTFLEEQARSIKFI